MVLIDIVYIASAVVGGILFLFRLILMIFGGGDHHTAVDLGDLSAADQADLGDVHDNTETDVSFKFLSIQGISAFFMMFGLVGLALSRSNFGPFWTVLGGVAAGIFTVWVVGLIFKGMKRLQADGTLRIENAIGKEGTVYLTIPAGGTGKVSVSVQGSLREFDAVSADRQSIPTGSRIRVVSVQSGTILVVKAVQSVEIQ